MKNFKIYIILITRIVELFFLQKSNCTKRFILSIITLGKSNGFAQMIKYMKTSRLHVTRYMCGSKLLVNSDMVAVTKDGFPTKFLYLKKYIDSKDNQNIRYVLTLFNITRGLVPNAQEAKKIVPKLNSITDEFKGTSKIPVPMGFIKDFVKTYGLKLDKPTYSLKDHYSSSKGGPAGKASGASQWSLFGHKNETILSLQYIFQEGFNNLFFIPGKLNQKLSYDKLEIVDGKLVITKPAPVLHIGKLSIVNDPECKKRVIAMVDYHSQLALRSIHKDLLKLLEKFPCDRTFTQDPFHKGDMSNKEYFYSLDLSSATDRFPIQLQERLLGELYGDQLFAQHGSNLLINRDFHYEGKKYRYSVGQPMGAYSSGAAFTLTHHMVVRGAAYKAGYPTSGNQYIILGDDIVIKDFNVASKYKGLMAKMGVDISLNKTHASKDTYEFAKRGISNGKTELSGIPFKGILRNGKHLNTVYSILSDYNQLIPNAKLLPMLEVIANVYNHIEYKPKRYISKRYVFGYLYDMDIAYKYASGRLTVSQLREYLVKILPEDAGIPNDGLILDYCKGVLSNGITIQLDGVLKSINKTIDSFAYKYKDTYHYICSSGIIHALSNRLDQLHKNCANGNNESLYDILDQFVIPDASRLSRKERNVGIRLGFLRSLFRQSGIKNFSEQRFPDNFYIERFGEKRLMGSVDAIDFTGNHFKVTSPGISTLSQRTSNTCSSLRHEVNSVLKKQGVDFKE